MNEIDFVGLARRCITGDVVLCHTEEATVRQPNPSFAQAAEEAEAAGIVIRFVDPAKPLLLFRTRSAGDAQMSATAVTVEIDFFQDALYAAAPKIEAERLSIWRHTTDSERATSASQWLHRVAEIVGRPLGTDTELFDAYAAGALSATYRDAVVSGGSLSDWLSAHMRALSVPSETLAPWRRDLSIWEGHDVYTFR